MRRVFSILLALSMLLTLAPIAFADELAPEQGYEFNGTMPTDKWEDVAETAQSNIDYTTDEATGNVTIKTALGLAWLAKQLNTGAVTDGYKGKTVTLEKSIDLSGKLWTPIGNDSHPFNGTFDGGNGGAERTDNIVITGLRCKNNTKQGLFGQVTSGKVENVTISDAAVYAASYAGALAGGTSGTTVEYCHVSNANVNSSSISYTYTGGLIGNAFTGTVKNCTVDHATVYGYGGYVGGLIGDGYVTITDCSTKNSVVSSNSWKIGGIIGQTGEGGREYKNDDVENVTLIGGFFMGHAIGGVIGFLNYTYGNTPAKLTDCDVKNITIKGITSSNTIPKTTIYQGGGLVGTFNYGTLVISNCTVDGVTFQNNDENSESETLLELCGGAIGGMYWRSSVEDHDYDVTLDNVSVSNVQFKCDEGMGLGTLIGGPYTGYDEAHIAKNTIKDSSVDKDSEVKSSVNGDKDFDLRVVGSNYPDGTITFDNTLSEVTFEGENNLPMEDLTAYPKNGENLVYDGDTIYNLKAVYETAKVTYTSGTAEWLQKIENPFSAEAFKKPFLDDIIKSVKYADISTLAETAAESKTIYIHITPILNVEQLESSDENTITLKLTPQYTAVANTDEKTSTGTTLKENAEVAVDWPVTVTIPLDSSFATEDFNFLDIRQKDAEGSVTSYYSSKIAVAEETSAKSATFTTDQGLGTFDITRTFGPSLKGIKLSWSNPSYENMIKAGEFEKQEDGTWKYTGDTIVFPSSQSSVNVTPDFDITNLNTGTYTFTGSVANMSSVTNGNWTNNDSKSRSVRLTYGENEIELTVQQRIVINLGQPNREVITMSTTYKIPVTREYPKNNVIVDANLGGTVTVEPESPVTMPETVTVTVTPDDGYEILGDVTASRYVSSSRTEAVEVTKSETEGQYTFTMPETEVTVVVRFVKTAEGDTPPTIVDQPSVESPKTAEGFEPQSDQTVNANSFRYTTYEPSEEAAQEIERNGLDAAEEEVTQEALDAAAEKLETEEEVYLHVKTTIETEIKEYINQGGVKKAVVDVSAHAHFILTTAEDVKDIHTTGGSINAVEIGDKEVEVTKPVRMTLAFPMLFVGVGNPVVISHDHNGTTYYYTSTAVGGVNGLNYVIFDNPNGFSEFTVTVVDGSKLRGITPSQGTLEPAFNPLDSEKEYSVNVPYSVTEITLTPVKFAETAQVEPTAVTEGLTATLNDEGAVVVSGLAVGENTVTVKVTSGANNTTYTVTINRAEYVPSTPSTYTVKTEEVENAEVELSASSATAGTEITVTVTPDENYHVSGVTVTAANGAAVEVTDNKDGTFTFVMPASNVTVTAEVYECPSMAFPDIDLAQWYHPYTDYAISHGLMEGTGVGFEPETLVTRAQMAVILWNLEGQPTVDAEIPFPDVAENEWYAEAIRWAASVEVVSGCGDGTFKPTDTITREQMATMLYNYEQKIGSGGFAADETYTLTFDDADQISDWAQEAVAWCTMKGVITGSENKFNPADTSKRSDLATILALYDQLAK